MSEKFTGVIPLYEPEGFQLRQDTESGKGYYEAESKPNGGASLAGPVPSYSSAKHDDKPVPFTGGVSSGKAGMGGSMRPSPGEVAHRALNPEELMALAQQMQDDISQQTSALDSQPSSVESTIQRDTNAPYWLRDYMGNK